MPSRKQRRRRQKLQRHEYEYVVETDEGEEVLESPRAVEQTPAQKRERQSRGTVGPAGPSDPASIGRPRPQTGCDLGPLLLVVTYITAPSLTTAQKIFNAALLIMIFLPFSYLVDLVVCRPSSPAPAPASRGQTDFDSPRK